MITAEQAKELLAAATRSPWRWERYGGLAELSGRAGDPETYEYDSPVLEFTHNGGCGCRAVCYAEVELSEPDADLIAAAPDLAQTVIDLAAENAALRAAVQRGLELADRLGEFGCTAQAFDLLTALDGAR